MQLPIHSFCFFLFRKLSEATFELIIESHLTAFNAIKWCSVIFDYIIITSTTIYHLQHLYYLCIQDIRFYLLLCSCVRLASTRFASRILHSKLLRPRMWGEALFRKNSAVRAMVLLGSSLLRYVKKPTYLPNPLAAAGLVRGPAAVSDIVPRIIPRDK